MKTPLRQFPLLAASLALAACAAAAAGSAEPSLPRDGIRRAAPGGAAAEPSLPSDGIRRAAPGGAAAEPAMPALRPAIFLPESWTATPQPPQPPAATVQAPLTILPDRAWTGVVNTRQDEIHLLGVSSSDLYEGGAAQYLDLSQIPFFAGKRYPTNYNLCGQLSVAAALGLDPIEVLLVFEDLKPGGGSTTDGALILATNEKTSIRNLEDLIHRFGWGTQAIGFETDPLRWREGQLGPPTPERVAELLAQGKAMIALVNLNRRSGKIQDPDLAREEEDNTPHWASLHEVEWRSEGAFVLVYNSFRDHEEWYSWESFLRSWELYPDNSNYRALIALP